MDIDYNKPANCAFTNKPLDNKKIKELLDQGLNKAEVARTLNISRMTVYRAINIKDNSDG